MRLVLQLTFTALILAYSVHLYRHFEPYIHPVITDFNIYDFKITGYEIIISGSMTKVRPCTFDYNSGLAIYGRIGEGVSTLLDYEFLDNVDYSNRVTSRAVGYQNWGPWLIKIPGHVSVDTLSIYASHFCVPFWTTQSLLIDKPIREILNETRERD